MKIDADIAGRTFAPHGQRQALKKGARAIMKRFYKTGWYGGATASIQTNRNGTATLTICGGGKRTRKTYNTERGARVALGKQYDGTWYEVKGGC